MDGVRRLFRNDDSCRRVTRVPQLPDLVLALLVDEELLVVLDA